MHRDITILVNDGEKTFEMMTADVKGCNANFRYHNDRADFKVTDGASARVEVTGNRLSLKIDPKATGEVRSHCFVCFYMYILFMINRFV